MSRQSADKTDEGSLEALAALEALGLPAARYASEGKLIAATGSFQQVFDRRSEATGPLFTVDEIDYLRSIIERDPSSWHSTVIPRFNDYLIAARIFESQPGTETLVALLPRTADDDVDLLAALPVGLVLFNAEGRMIRLNPALQNYLAIKPEAVSPPTADVFWTQVANRTTAIEMTEASLRQAAAQPTEQTKVELELKGEPRQYLQAIFFQNDDSSWGAIFIDYSAARDQASWKLELLSTLARDLRTPLATLKGHATALMANYTQWSPAMVLEFLQAMDQGVDDLVRQVDRSLALTRLESGRLGLQPEPVTAHDLIQGGLERAASSLADFEIEIELSPEIPELRVDPARIEEVIANLLENAASANPADEPITLSANSSEVMATFTVRDRGPGVPVDTQATIFERHGETEDPGLGLFISRQIVEAHGGRIWLESPPPGQDRGAAISFTVPLKPTARSGASEAAGAAPVQPAIAERTILVVEHDIDLQSLLKAILEPAGYRLTMANSGPSALDQLAGQQPAAVILDLALPRMNGLTVCRTIRRRVDIPILALLAQAEAQTIISAVDAGADDYLVKPFQSTELLARLQALLRRAERSPAAPASQTLSFDGLEIRESSRQVSFEGQAIDLTPTEFELLSFLAHHSGQVLTHNQLIEALWPLGRGNRHSLFVHINRLRAKLEPDPENPRYIVTRWGVGYTFFPSRRAG